MYEDAHGPIPDGLLVTHICGVKLCCNPEHPALARRNGQPHVVVISDA